MDSIELKPIKRNFIGKGGKTGFAILILITLLFAQQTVLASDSLLELFIKKGFVTEQEAAQIKAEAEATTNSHSAMPVMTDTKWKANNKLGSVELFGDVRVRLEDREVKDAQGGEIQLMRMRYSLRLGLRGEVFDDFNYGFRVESGPNARSPWLTMGQSSSGTPYQGPFGKSTAGINLGQAFISWHPDSWGEITVGKMPNPLYTTAMVWDGDISPEGLSEKFKYSIGEADFFANFGQFLYQDTNPTKTSSGYFNIASGQTSLPFLLAWQLGFNYHITKDTSLKVAPVVYNYTGRGANNLFNTTTPDFSGVFVGQGSTNGLTGGSASSSGFPGGSYGGFVANQTGVNDLMVLQIPWELNFKISELDARFFGDYAVNLQGADRARAAYLAQQSPLLATSGLSPIAAPQTKDTKAYQIGFAIGNRDAIGLVTGATSRRNAWECRIYWQHVEQYALDPNLLDSDFFEGRGNMEGVYAAVSYGFRENIFGTIRFGSAHQINREIGTGGGNQDIPQMNAIERYRLIQADMTVKF